MPVLDSSALAGIRVIDLADELAAYASRLLVDLGAEVIRVEPPGGSSARRVAPIVAGPDMPMLSTFERFVNAGKRSVTLNLETAEGVAILVDLLRSADLVIESAVPVLEALGISSERLREINPRIGQVIVTPFGLDHVPAWAPANDLIVMGAGGLLHLGGYPDVGPVTAYGSQSRFAASIFAAVAALTALLQRDLTGEAGTFDVSAQECVAQALEDSAATYALTGRVRERQGDRPREAGTGIYRCRDGYVSMVAGRLGTARAWTALVQWLNDDDTPEAVELLEERWNQFAFRQSPEAIADFVRIFEAFALKHDKQELYVEAQARMIALSPVSSVDDVLGNKQLAFRDFFIDVADSEFEKTMTYPRAPYSLSETPALAPRAAPRVGEDNVPVLVDEFGISFEAYRSLVERGVV